MPIYLHLANLIIEKTTIIKKYKGGIKQFRIDHEINGEDFFQEDDELFALWAMNVDEFDDEMDVLIANGLRFNGVDQFTSDFVIKPRYGHYLWEADWLEDNKVLAWHINCDEKLKACAKNLGEASMDEISQFAEFGNDMFEMYRRNSGKCR